MSIQFFLLLLKKRFEPKGKLPHPFEFVQEIIFQTQFFHQKLKNPERQLLVQTLEKECPYNVIPPL